MGQALSYYSDSVDSLAVVKGNSLSNRVIQWDRNLIEISIPLDDFVVMGVQFSKTGLGAARVCLRVE